MFNRLTALPKVPYNILSYLALSPSAENIWKMLKYNSYDALSQPNLSFDEKMDLVWREGTQEKFGVFFTNLVEDAITESKCIFKCYQYYIHANPNSYNSTVVYAFDFLYGGNMSLVGYEGVPVNRGDLFIHEVLKTLNGVDVGGVGKLIFDDNQSRYDAGRSVIGDSKKFTGVTLYLSTMIGDIGDEGCGT